MHHFIALRSPSLNQQAQFLPPSHKEHQGHISHHLRALGGELPPDPPITNQQSKI
jgi:hypothetical protein